MQETQVRSLGWVDSLKKGMATHSSILAWRISSILARWAWQAIVHVVTKSRTWLTQDLIHVSTLLDLISMCALLSRVWLFCNAMDCSPPGSSVHGIFQARILEWVAFHIRKTKLVMLLVMMMKNGPVSLFVKWGSVCFMGLGGRR